MIQQVGAPLELYKHPANLFVAGFIGSPSMNFVPVTIRASGEALIADAGAFQVILPPAQSANAQAYIGKPCIFGIRPEHIHDKSLVGLVKPTEGNTVQADVDVLEPLGSNVEMYLKAGEHALVAEIDSATAAKTGDRIAVIFDMDESHLFDKDTEQAIY